MATPSLGQFVKQDPLLAISSVSLPIVLLLFALREKHLAEQMRPNLIGISQSFSAVLISALCVIIALALGMVISGRLQGVQGIMRLLSGLGVGLVSSVVGVVGFWLVAG